MTADETIFAKDGVLGRILLNRPQALNALSPRQFTDLAERLGEWAADPTIAVVVIEGAGERAFSAGGDIRVVWDAHLRGDHRANVAIFRDEYRLDRLIHHYPKPYVSVLDGIVMGGGAGVSVNGRTRIATERTLFAMPETAIGFFPDVGATHFLSRLPGRLGLYLGLTGARLGPEDCLWAGIATHYVPSAEIPAMIAELARGGEVDKVLTRFHRHPGESGLARIQDGIERCFGQATLVEIVEALAGEQSDWAQQASASLARHSPTALHVAFVQLTEGKGLGFDESIRREFRLACRFLLHPDFPEGIRAMVVDKDKAPRWLPAGLGQVDPDHVRSMFAPLGKDELEFPPDPRSS